MPLDERKKRDYQIAGHVIAETLLVMAVLGGIGAGIQSVSASEGWVGGALVGGTVGLFYGGARSLQVLVWRAAGWI